MAVTTDLESIQVENREARSRRVLWAALAIGLLVRIVLWWKVASVDTQIVDEQHYRQIAENLIAGNGFAWGPGRLTSMRPPLYPGLLALTWSLVGGVNLQVVRILQIGLALVTTG